jgi:predicted 2-oxoglutarate/Fe(II)-dependent dioxygenase YbiX/peroxiredoxin
MVDFSQRPKRDLELGAELGRGDRVPNFRLPDQSGRGVMFYEQVQGRPIVLVVHQATRVAAHRAVLKDLIAIADQAGAHFFAIGSDGVAAHAALELDALLLADTEGRIGAALTRGTSSGQSPELPVVLVCDPNQRLLDIAVVADDGAAVAVVRAALGRLARAAPGTFVRHAAPVLFVPDVLDEVWCARLIALWHDGHEEGRVATYVTGAVENRLTETTKRRLDHAITDRAVLRDLSRTLARRIAPELVKAFHFQGFWFEPFIVMCYDAARGDFFRPHRDNLIPAFANRRFAITLNLNTGAYEGGDLRFPEYGDDVYVAPAGGALLFSCSLLHEALPVTRGRRFALLGFLRSDKRDGAAPAG